MDPTRCPHCNRRMMAVATSDGRTALQCLQCDKVDPLKTDAVKWADSPLASPTKEPAILAKVDELCVERERQVRQRSGKVSRHEQGLLTCQASDAP
jgi:hypothetical protein